MTGDFSRRQEYKSGKRRHSAGCTATTARSLMALAVGLQANLVARGSLFNISMFMLREMLVDRASCVVLLEGRVVLGHTGAYFRL